MDFVYFDAGGGHRSAALALQDTIQKQGRPEWDVSLVNLQEVLDPLDVFRKITGKRLQDIYNLVLAKGWTLGSRYLLPAMHGVIRVLHRSQVDLLIEFWKSRKPDLVVSLIPNFNRALFESLKKALPSTKFVTILTDLADFPPHFWMERQRQYLVCGTDRAMEQAQALGFGDGQLFRASGMILRPQFYDVARINRTAELAKLQLQPHLPTILVLFGGEGSNKMYAIARDLGNSVTDLQLICLCGKNEELRKKLGTLRTRNRVAAVGFTSEVPKYMQMADIFIGKPGPGSISEALHMGLPVIVERNAWTLPQERFNTEWIAKQGVGSVLRNFRRVDMEIREILEGGAWRGMKARAEALNNRAVFEIAHFLESLLDEQDGAAAR